MPLNLQRLWCSVRPRQSAGQVRQSANENYYAAVAIWQWTVDSEGTCNIGWQVWPYHIKQWMSFKKSTVTTHWQIPGRWTHSAYHIPFRSFSIHHCYNDMPSYSWLSPIRWWRASSWWTCGTCNLCQSLYVRLNVSSTCR